MKLWDGRFKTGTSNLYDEFANSISYDYILFKYDVQGSMAHTEMLKQIKVLTELESSIIQDGLTEILQAFDEGQLIPLADHEDVHMWIEALLIDKVGEVGKKLHTGRSRNDQVALDLKLYMKDALISISDVMLKLLSSIIELSETHKATVMPGYTHLQKAQPVYFGFHMMSYFQMFKRDYERLKDVEKRLDVMPLGSGALAGVNYNSDRVLVANLLGFESVTQHAMDSVSDRDHVVEFTSTASIIMMHLSRLCEELVTWSSQEFSYVELSDGYATGSSIMPQKKNPDTPELIRGKTGRVYGNLIQILTVMKSLPLAYNKDMQEDKEALFDTVYTVEKSLLITKQVLETMTVNKDTMLKSTQKGYLNATDVADYIVAKGGTFRQAHNVVGKLVLYAISLDKELEQLALDEFNQFSPIFENDIYDAIRVNKVIENKLSLGSTSSKSLEKIIFDSKHYLKATVSND